jgi:hypothetical protein
MDSKTLLHWFQLRIRIHKILTYLLFCGLQALRSRAAHARSTVPPPQKHSKHRAFPVSFFHHGSRHGCDWGVDLSLWWGAINGCVQNLNPSFHRRHLLISHIAGAHTIAIEGVDILLGPNSTLSPLAAALDEYGAFLLKQPARSNPDVPVAIIIATDQGTTPPPPPTPATSTHSHHFHPLPPPPPPSPHHFHILNPAHHSLSLRLCALPLLVPAARQPDLELRTSALAARRPIT